MLNAPALTSKPRELRTNGLAMLLLVLRLFAPAKRMAVVGELVGGAGVQLAAFIQSPVAPPPIQIDWAGAGAAVPPISAAQMKQTIHRGRGARLRMNLMGDNDGSGQTQSRRFLQDEYYRRKTATGVKKEPPAVVRYITVAVQRA